MTAESRGTDNRFLDVLTLGVLATAKQIPDHADSCRAVGYHACGRVAASQ